MDSCIKKWSDCIHANRQAHQQLLIDFTSVVRPTQSDPSLGQAASAIYLMDLETADGRPVDICFHFNFHRLDIVLSCPDDSVACRIKLPAAQVALSLQNSRHDASEKLPAFFMKKFYISASVDQVNLAIYHTKAGGARALSLCVSFLWHVYSETLTPCSLLLQINKVAITVARVIDTQGHGQRSFFVSSDVDALVIDYDVGALALVR